MRRAVLTTLATFVAFGAGLLLLAPAEHHLLMHAVPAALLIALFVGALVWWVAADA